MSHIKLGLYGDSFVETWPEEKKKYLNKEHYSLTSWPTLIAKKFDLEIVHSGKGGTSYWDIPINQFSLSNVPDILIFCWTSSARLYNKQGIQLHPDPGKIWWQKGDVKNEYVEASKQYYKYIHDTEKEILEYQSCLHWFDNCILDKIPTDRKILHLWSFGHNKDNYHPNNIKYLHTWENGLEIRPACMSISLMDGCSVDQVDPFENHMNTQEKHNLMADFISHSLESYDINTLNDYSDNVIKNLTS